MLYVLTILLSAALGAGFMFAHMRYRIDDARTVSGLSELDFELAMTRARWNRKRMEKW